MKYYSKDSQDSDFFRRVNLSKFNWVWKHSFQLIFVPVWNDQTESARQTGRIRVVSRCNVNLSGVNKTETSFPKKKRLYGETSKWKTTPGKRSYCIQRRHFSTKTFKRHPVRGVKLSEQANWFYQASFPVEFWDILIQMYESCLSRDSCSWNLSKSKTFSPANQIAQNKHIDEELESYWCVIKSRAYKRFMHVIFVH